MEWEPIMLLISCHFAGLVAQNKSAQPTCVKPFRGYYKLQLISHMHCKQCCHLSSLSKFAVWSQKAGYDWKNSVMPIKAITIVMSAFNAITVVIYCKDAWRTTKAKSEYYKKETFFSGKEQSAKILGNLLPMPQGTVKWIFVELVFKSMFEHN